MKKVLTLVLTLALIFTLSACGGKREDSGEIVVNVLDELPAETTTIQFWHIYGQGKAALLDKMIAEFEAEYPNIKVDSVSQGSYSDLLSKTKKAIGTGVTPDVIVGYPDHFAEYIDLGGIIPLDKFIESEKWGVDLNDFVDSYVAENQQYSDGMYSMPYSKSTEMLVYNKTYFSAQGYEFTDNQVLTWEEIETMADKMVGTGDNQCEFMINYDSSANLFINASKQWGAGYTDDDGNILVDNPTTKSMLDYFKGLIDEDILALPLEWEEAYGSKNFLAKDVCMTVGSTAGISYNDPAKQLEPAEQFDIGVLPIPQFDGKTEAAMQQGPNIAVMENADDAERLASWLFLTFLTNSENTARWAIDTGYLPVRKSGFASTLYQEFLNNPDADYLVESDSANAAYAQIGYNKYDPAFAGIGKISSAKAREEAGYAFEAVYVGTLTVEQALEEMIKQLTW